MTRARLAAYRILGNPLLWSVIEHTLGTASTYYEKAKRIRSAEHHRQQALYLSVEEKMRPYVNDLIVRNGPFAGMSYPSKRATGSAFYPKLLGSYESELHSVITAIIETPYESILDIGCAEGYYAVGLKIRKPKTHVYAYDIDPRSRFLCAEMARLNLVDIHIHDFCDQGVLLNTNLGSKSLIIMDCEGYEYELVDAALAQKLQRHDFLIESHDNVRIDTTKKLMAAFSQTHSCEVIVSKDDIFKAYEYEYPELEKLTLEERKVVLEEYRQSQMRWLFAKANQW